MICENMTVVDAIEHVKKRRRIIPNWGFLKQLRELDQHLLEKGGNLQGKADCVADQSETKVSGD